jgi:GT2 family glycosyltransferase
MPAASIVIPTHDRLPQLQRVLEALAHQERPMDDVEVVVVSDGSSDGTDEHLARLEPPFAMVACATPNRGPAAARNRGVELASGDLVLFLDDDVVPTTAWLGAHLDAHARAGDVVVIGPMVTPPGAVLSPWVRWMHGRIAEQYVAMTSGRWAPTARQFFTGNASLARRHVIDAGGFDPSFTRAEDVELAYRLDERGLRFVFAPEAVGHHHEERSFSSWASIPSAYGRNDIVLAQDHGRGWIDDVMRAELAERHPLHRGLVRACGGRARATDLATRAGRALGAAADVLGLGAVQRLAYSTVFNLRYYHAAIETTGGRHAFFSEQIHDPTRHRAPDER